MAEKTVERTPRDDKFARESFTFRRMTPTQVWAISIVAAAVLIAALGYTLIVQ